jgi:uncharacterized protein
MSKQSDESPPIGLPFLSAEWSDLVVINYKVDPAILHSLVPIGTELDDFEGDYFISLVGFMFRRNKFLGLIPTWPSAHFEEVNLRFYIKRIKDGEVRRAVAFYREVVPSRIIASAARHLYNEPYQAMPMGHRISEKQVTYIWTPKQSEPCQITADRSGEPQLLKNGSFEHFILEHYWGYTQQRDGSTVEYRVQHEPWLYWPVNVCHISDEVKKFYGPRFEDVLNRPPHSVFVAKGSPVAVSWPRRFYGKLKLSQLPPNENVKGWILYDGACGFCSWWIPFWKPTIQGAGYDSAPVQASWVRDNLKMTHLELTQDIRLLFRDGRMMNGADAYLHIMKRVWWLAPIGLILSLPLLRWLTWQFYKNFNSNRFLISKICRLPPEVK